jgi:DNA polymerase, archaea type
MKAFIVDRTYRIIEGKAYVYLFGRLDSGESFLAINARKPYFYIKEKDLAKAKKLATFEEEDAGTRRPMTNMAGEPVAKVILQIPKDVPEVRRAFEEHGISCFEADIPFTQRVLMDLGIKATLDIHGTRKQGRYVNRIYEEPELTPVDLTPNLTTLSLDIETSFDGKDLYVIGMVMGKKAVSLFLKSKKHAEHEKQQASHAEQVQHLAEQKLEKVEFFDEEKALLERFAALMREWDPDVLTGWNLIDFDLQDLKARFDKHKIPFILGRAEWPCNLRIEQSFMKDSSADFPGRMVLDGIHLLKSSFIRLDDYKLETAAQEFLGEGKLIVGENRHEEIERLYKEDIKKLLAYNRQDCDLVLRILDKAQLIELTALRSAITGITMERVRGSIASFDSVYIRAMNARGIVAPSGTFTEKPERITGGFVRDSKPGIYDYILVLDFKSMYPSVMRTFNIDPVSFLPGHKEKKSTKEIIVAPNGACFRNDDGILPDIIQHLWQERDKAKRRNDPVASQALKTLMNSFFGVLASPNCRFFSLEMGNAITHFARQFIKLAAEKIEDEGYDVIYGDSITSERPIIIRERSHLKIVSAESLFQRYSLHATWRGQKEVVKLDGIETLSFDPKTGRSCFKKIKELIRHKAEKRIFRVNQKYGETRCTEDHSLIREGDFRETKPQELDRGVARIERLPALKRFHRIDLLRYLDGYVHISSYKGREKKASICLDENYLWFSWIHRKHPVKVKRFIDFPSAEGDALLRLLGIYTAEGSSSTPETTSTRWGAAIAGRKQQMEKCKKDYLLLFENVRVRVIPSQRKVRQLSYTTQDGQKHVTYEDSTHKLNMMNQLSAVLFKELAGQKSIGKKVPDLLFHLSTREQLIFLESYLLGDGSREKKQSYTARYRERHFRCTTKSTLLVAGLSFLLKQLGFSLSIRYRPSKGVYTIASSDRNNVRLATKVTEEPYAGYVYDLSVVDTHLFVDGCGQLLLHNTDSVFVATKASSVSEAERIGKKIETTINAFYKESVKKEYHRENYMELQAEKIFRKFMLPTVRGSEVGAKKRYAGLLVKDGKEELDFTGLEFVRRDWTEAAKRFQMELLDKIFKEEEVTEYIKKFVQDVRAGKHDDLLVYRKSIRKELVEYTKMTPPHVKAARILEEKEGKLQSTIIEYVMTKNGAEPLAYLTAPIDYDHYIDKQLKPLADSVLGFYGTTFDELLSGHSQTTLFGY